jgi:hypothetical protein
MHMIRTYAWRCIRTRTGEAPVGAFSSTSSHRFDSAVPKACSSRFGWGAPTCVSGNPLLRDHSQIEVHDNFCPKATS